MTDPTLQLFPLELWEKILLYVTDARDVMAFLEVYPHVRERAMEKNGQEWLFDQILPIIRDKIRCMDLANCRLVSKNWKIGVDKYLLEGFQNIYHSTEEMPSVYLQPRRGTRVESVRSFNSLANWHVWLENYRAAEWFEAQIRNRPPGINPYQGRRLQVMFPTHQYWRQFNPILRQVTMNIIQSHGHHLFYLRLASDLSDFGILVINALTSLPNLKILDLVWSEEPRRPKRNGCREAQWKRQLEDIEEQRDLVMPHVLSLTCIASMKLSSPDPNWYDQVVVFPPYLMHQFFATYHEQLVKLCISEAEWQNKYENLCLPKLEYFSLYYALDKRRVRYILFSISTSLASLKSLELQLKVWQHRHPSQSVVSFEEIVNWIKMFPELEHFEFELAANVVKKYTLDDVQSIQFNKQELIEIPSIRSMNISWPKMHLLGQSFLNHFPQLQVAVLMELNELSTAFKVWNKRKYEIVTPYEWDVWRKLPYLQEITIGPFEVDSEIGRYYNRTTWEWDAILQEGMLYFRNLLI